MWEIIGVVFASGCVGGLISGLFDKPENPRGYLLWHQSTKCETIFPGFLAKILLGGIASVVFWSLYGPFSGLTLIGTPPVEGEIGLTIGQCASCLLIGIGGPGFLFAEAKKRCTEDQLRKKDQKQQTPLS